MVMPGEKRNLLEKETKMFGEDFAEQLAVKG